MNGDLGNLLTGEMGEAESRFAYDDFAEAYGRRVAGRVRRRRAVRAAGVGGGTMLTAGALVVGATHMPWEVLGAAPGMGGSDCVTPLPSDGAYAYEVLVRKGDTPGYTASLTDTATGAAFLTATLQPDGTYVFTDVDGNPLKATAEAAFFSTDVDGKPLMSTADELYEGYWVIGPQASPEDWGTAPPGAAEILVKSVSTTDFVGLPSAVARALDDCYTPSPTRSVAPSLSTDIYPVPDPSLAAKPEDVTSPFQCRFTFPTESGGTDGLAITARTASADEVRAEFERRFGNEPLTTYAGDAAGVWATATGMPLTASVYRKGLSVLDPLGTAGFNNVLEGVPGAAQLIAHGMSFVGVRDGVVVATVAPANDGTAPGTVLAPNEAPDSVVLPASDGAAPGMVLENFLGSDPSAFLLDRSVLTACDSSAGNLDSLRLYAVAGYAPEFSSPDAHMTYAWTAVPTP